MPLISSIGRKSPKTRALHTAIYAALILGSITMIYPFLLMISGSTKSAVDIKDFNIVPRFLYDDTALYQKHVEGLFNEQLAVMQSVYDLDTHSFDAVTPPTNPQLKLVAAWQDFLTKSPPSPYHSSMGYIWAPISRCMPLNLRAFKRDLIHRFDGDITAMNRELGTEFVNWNAFLVLPEDYTMRRSTVLNSGFDQAQRDFKATQGNSYYFSIESFYKARFLKTQYTRDIAEYNRSHNTTHTSYNSVHLPPGIAELHSATEAEQSDWETFARNTLNLLWLRVTPDTDTSYRQYLQSKYSSIEVLNNRYQTNYKSFEDIPLIDNPAHITGLSFSDWNAFITGWKDPDTGQLHQPTTAQLRIHCIDFEFQDYLRDRFQYIAQANQILGTTFDDFHQISPPQQTAHYQTFLAQRSELRKEFIVRNYATVIDYMLLHGRGIFNTVIYCLLAVLAALIVNPLAAYALSRYRLPTTYKILLFMLLTMAFPPMVTQIPVFIMLRDLQLLNTFAALVLPGLAHGYSIFLLKGFFDSLPRELYESAEMDGANEWILFWNITMSLSKPILAVVALQAFNLAYSNFMFALLICQDESMWTLMVWLYQLQQRSGQAVMYASLLIASIPTFIVFLFCQNIIMRGIIVPVEK